MALEGEEEFVRRGVMMYPAEEVVCTQVHKALRASQVALVAKNPPASSGDIGGVGPTPGSGRSPGGGNGNPLLYSCLENPRDGRAWQAIVHGVARSWT